MKMTDLWLGAQKWRSDECDALTVDAERRAMRERRG